MILYHFTQIYNFTNVGPENIQAVGLKPFPARPANSLDFLGIVTPPVVWLTTNRDPNGLRAKDGTAGFAASHLEACVSVVIPSTDRRLVQWGRWLRKRVSRAAIEAVEAVCREKGINALTEWYIYLGLIPPRQIRSYEWADAETMERAEAKWGQGAP